ncbi:MAG: hypothetical protein ACI9U2_002351 [Bradymonadia bacterium]|jgi:hypothetical protein
MTFRLPGAPIWLAAALCVGCIEETAPADETPTDAAQVDAMVDDAQLPEPDANSEPTPDANPEPMPEPVPACGNEDDLAPNQTADDATPVEPGFVRTDLFLCPESSDWFAVPLDAGLGFTVRLKADPPEVDLDLAIVDADGEVLAESANDGGNELIEFVPEAAGTVWVRVSGYQDEAAFYALLLSTGCSLDAQCPDDQLCDRYEGQCKPVRESVCGNDAFEDNDRDTDAAAVPDGGRIDAMICGVDRDWYAIDAADGDIYDVLIQFPERQDVDLFVIEAESGELVATARGDARTNPERLQLSNVPAGRYLVGVRLFVPADEQDREIEYTLQIVGRSGGCNIDRDCANPLYPVCDASICRAVDGQGLVALGGRCGEDNDCGPDADFCYTGGAGGHDNFCTVQCGGPGSCGALGAESYCLPVQRDFAVCVPPCASNDDCSGFRTCDAGVCELRGECQTDRECGEGESCLITQFGRYCRETPPPPFCGMDAANDPNDVQDQATVIAADGVAVEGLNLCNVDSDWYQVTVPPEAAAFTLSLGAEFPAGIDIDVYIFDENGRSLGESSSPDQQAEFVEIRFIAPGTYFMQVDQFDGPSLDDTVYSVTATLADNDDRCTVEGGECNRTNPLRIACDVDTGACSDLDGAGMVEPGGACDSQDDCSDASEFCWNFEGGAEGVNICSSQCAVDADCAGIEGTECQLFQQGQFGACLPPRE